MKLRKPSVKTISWWLNTLTRQQ